MSALQSKVYNRGAPPASFLNEQVAWAHAAFVLMPELFARNNNFDIYNKVFFELGPWVDDLHRVAVMCEVQRVLAGFESSWNHNAGVDSSRRTETTRDNAEAGAFQQSYDARYLDPSLKQFLECHNINDGLVFQQRMKKEPLLSFEFTTRVLRTDVRNYDRIPNGPVRKGDERRKTWPDRPELWKAEQSIYPWLRRDAVAEYKALLSA